MKDKVAPIRASTQSFVEIHAITNDMVLFTDGSCAIVISATAVNFGLLSEKEQDAIIFAYAGLLNSLSFPIQILIRTQHKDITAYLQMLEESEKKQTNPKLATSIKSYRKFVAATVKEKDVLDKKFYVIIPFSYLELGVSSSILFGGSKKRGLPFPKTYIMERAVTVLTPKKDHIVKQLNRIGLQAKQLTNDQLARLYFEIYNQGAPLATDSDLSRAIQTP